MAQTLTRVRSIDAGGRLSTIIGRDGIRQRRSSRTGGDGGHASAGFTDADAIAPGPRGLVLLDDLGPGRRLRLIAGADGYIRDGDERIVPDPDGDVGVGVRRDRPAPAHRRHHDRSRRAQLRVRRRRAGSRASLDGEDQALVVERDGAGAPLAVRAPSGARSVIGLDADGRLGTLTTPAGRASARRVRRRTGCWRR